MNTFGKMFKISIYGESHGPSVGVIISGIEPGIKVDYNLIDEMLTRRRPLKFIETTRVETDNYVIESGINEGYTTGTPILVRILNEKQQEKDYQKFKDIYRPSHVDFVVNEKYQGFNNLSGSGHFSGRLTAPLVVAGAFAKMCTNYEINSAFTQIGELTDLNKMAEYLEKIKAEKDSVGAIIKLEVKNVEVGLGEPFFAGVDSLLASALYSIPAVKGVSFGAGFAGVKQLGSEYNDCFVDAKGKTATNNAGGINGGITNGNDLIINVFVRAVSSIGKKQKTFNFSTNKEDVLVIEGRHDSFIGNRIKVVLESMVYLVLYDLLLQKRARQSR